ncbi:MAG: cytochrome c3 family protein [Polyangiaceae bacterium]|nr:cytochrome c3 family protein [Myxococcales bacterium]MCC6898972.1 cytochrome c3 family protein [Polyangiaceae bacterium]
MNPFTFPRWANKTRQLAGVVIGVAPVYLTALVWYGFSPKTTDAGYQPKQPVAYSHALHAGQLGIDCRYCHNTVDRAAHAASPPTETCMNCHARIRKDSDLLAPIRQSASSGEPVQWVKVHDLPDYVYFNHSAHVTRGVGCVSCHGRVDRMAEVSQVESLSMGWCLTCHRDPAPHLRPPSEATNMSWQAPSPTFGAEFKKANNINPPEDCSACHR